MSPFSSSTMRTSSGLAMLAIITCRTPDRTGLYRNFREEEPEFPFRFSTRDADEAS